MPERKTGKNPFDLKNPFEINRGELSKMGFTPDNKKSDEKTKRTRILAHQKADVWQRQKGKCAKCKLQLTEHPKNYHIDHKKPLSQGGTNEPSNLQFLCGSCHTQKSNLEVGQRAEKMRKEKKNNSNKPKNPFNDFMRW